MPLLLFRPSSFLLAHHHRVLDSHSANSLLEPHNTFSHPAWYVQGLWRQHRGLFVQQNSCTRWLRHPSLATSSLPHVQVAHSSLRSCRSQFKCYGFHTAEKNQILGRSAAQGTNVLIIPPMSSDPPIQPLRRMYTLGWRKCRGIRVDRWKQMYDLPSQQEWSWRITATLTIAQPSLHREKKKCEIKTRSVPQSLDMDQYKIERGHKLNGN